MSSTEVNQQNTTVFSLSYQASTALPKWAFKFSGKTMESQGKTPSKSPPIESRNTEYFKRPFSTHAQTAIWALLSTTWSFTVTTLSLFWKKLPYCSHHAPLQNPCNIWRWALLYLVNNSPSPTLALVSSPPARWHSMSQNPVYDAEVPLVQAPAYHPASTTPDPLAPTGGGPTNWGSMLFFGAGPN